MVKRFAFLSVLLALVSMTGQAWSEEKAPYLSIVSFQPEQPLVRAQRPAIIVAVVEYDPGLRLSEVKLSYGPGIHDTDTNLNSGNSLSSAGREVLRFEVIADEAKAHTLRLQVAAGDKASATAELTLNVLPPVPVQKLPYIPEPEPVKTDILVGAHNCPLWEADKFEMWSQILKHPERTPALGFYAQENPEVADWETKWAVEHGVNFFIYCWYRASQGEPVKMRFDSAIHDAFFKSKFADKMKFTIMWENQSKGQAGVADEKDLLENLLPFWIENYFKHPSYLKVDNKPLLFIYRPEFLIEDLGGEAQVVAALNRMREACKAAGFDGLYILGEYRGLDPAPLQLMKRLGLDYSFAYCWYVPNNPTPEQAVAAQLDYIRKTQELGILPQVVTVSQAWSGWADEGTIWKIPPTPHYENLLSEAKNIISTFPADQLGSKMLLLDNWNEWGEGHYIAPYREYGFGYLDAVRRVFSDAPEEHVDLLPEDIGMGPYDTAYKEHAKREAELRSQLSIFANKQGSDDPGLIAWWAFDEEGDAPVTPDYSGHGMGGLLRDATRAPGIDGNALVCEGGSVEVAPNPRLSPPSALTVECWVMTNEAGQDNKWFVNRVFGGGTTSGYRLGLRHGKPCFQIPVTEWSHHLSANVDLPTGRWVHLAGTFDGQVMRIYVDGEEQGSLERPEAMKASPFHLILGNYEVGHGSHFTGLLDEVRLYDRALTQDEVRLHRRARPQYDAVPK